MSSYADQLVQWQQQHSANQTQLPATVPTAPSAAGGTNQFAGTNVGTNITAPGRNTGPAAASGGYTGSETGGGPVGSAPGVSGTGQGGWDWSQALTGHAGYGAMQTSQNYIYNPQAGNYTIAGMGDYAAQNQAERGAYQGLGQNAQQQTGALADTANNQNTAYQNNVNSSTQNFLNNASGQGNYNDAQASQGSDQQNAAYNAITNMAQGNGPSLAGKNLQAGLNQQNQAVQAQSMSNQGLGGAGNAQRNALNAQAANTNNYLENAQQASTAEQLGALSQQNAAANNIRSSNQAQASAASSAGLAQRSLTAGALQNQYSANLAGNSLANNTALNALGLGYSTQLGAIGGAVGTSNNQFNANVAQQNANQAYDTALQNEGNTRATINTNAVQSGAQQQNGLLSLGGNIASGLAKGLTSGGSDDISQNNSDQNMKTDIDQSSNTTSALQSILGSLSPENKGLDADLANKSVPQPPTSGVSPLQKSSSSSGGGGGGLGGALGTAATIAAMFLL